MMAAALAMTVVGPEIAGSFKGIAGHASAARSARPEDSRYALDFETWPFADG